MFAILFIIARAGGGGSGGGGGGAVGIIVIPFIIAGYLISKYKRNKRIKIAQKKLNAAAQNDPSWDESALTARAKDVFMRFQTDWSTFNTEPMREYLTATYYAHIVLMLRALWQMHRSNRMNQVSVTSAVLFGVQDHAENDKDSFNVDITALADDRLIDESSGQTLYMGDAKFEEIWNFTRDDGTWKLDGITQINNSGLVVQYQSKVNKKYTDFAERNGYYYNADYGWLLLPTQGVLFAGSHFGISDINHHVIGDLNGNVVQFYEYVPVVQDKATWKDHWKHFYKRSRSPMAVYTIATMMLPKNYENIRVERRSGAPFLIFPPRGMTHITLEWGRFNKLFNVYATDMDKVTSLELLHPLFMEKLAALPYKTNIEIAGNNLYLYTTDKNADYQTMLAILADAYKEMKM